MSLDNTKFVTPKGEDLADADGGSVTIVTTATWTTATALAFAAVGKLGDVVAGSSGKVVCDFLQPTKMRVQASVVANPTTASTTCELDIRVYDSKNDELIASSVEGPTSIETGTPGTFTIDVVGLIQKDAELVVQAINNTDTDNVDIDSAVLSVWHP